MNSYEDKILTMQESIADDCTDCEYKTCCRNQCTETTKHYNPVIEQWMKKSRY